MTPVVQVHDPHVYWRRHLPSIRSRESPRGGTINRTGRSEGPCAHGATYLWHVRVSSRSRRTRDFQDFRRGAAEPVTRCQVNAKTAIVKARVRHNDGKASIYLVDRPRNIDRTPLGQDGIARPLRHARIRCEGSCGVLRQAPSEKEALGFAARKLRSAAGILHKNEWRADSELFKRADTTASEAAPIKSAYASASNLSVAMSRWIECTRQNC